MTDTKLLARFFPFLLWFPVSTVMLRSDLLAGMTGALILVPKAMAYAQLSGLPLYFGLYTAFVPAIVGALWGSSRQLATGPVAIVSLMTAAAVTPLAVPGSADYIGLALLLTLLVGLIQLLLGVVRLGTIVNFVSHPVILGFMNAAAIIIALSQLDLLLGIPKGRSDFFLYDVWEMLGYLKQVHLPTLAMSLFALALMLVLKKIAVVAKTSVLLTVIITILVSALLGYEKNIVADVADVADPAIRQMFTDCAATGQDIDELSGAATALNLAIRQADRQQEGREAADLRHRLELLQLDLQRLQDERRDRLRAIYQVQLIRAQADAEATPLFYPAGRVDAGAITDNRRWRIKAVDGEHLKLVGGGDVVGAVPAGHHDVGDQHVGAMLPPLLTAALIIALVAFMESISMAKAMASKSKQHIDPNQELIGQGLANISGSFFQSYPACGSFTGSAINLQAGAKTGFAMVFNGIFVAATLLFLTPLIYHLPKAVLAVIILLAVTGLVTPQALKHTWKASRPDGIVALVTFGVTLVAAPHLDKGIIVGTVLAIGLYLYRTMAPRVAVLGRYHDGTLRDLRVHPELSDSSLVAAIRFDGSLYFANVSHFEDGILTAVANHKKARFILVVGDGINYIDSSGEETVHHLVAQLHESGVQLVFSGLKKQILDVMRATGLFDLIGEQNIFATEDQALAAIAERLGEEAQDEPLFAHP